jgi:aminopeptidase N
MLGLLAAVLVSGSAAWGATGMICRYCGRDHSELAAEAMTHASGRKYAPDRVVDVQHIKIDVVPDFKKRTVAGVTTLTFAPISKPVEQVTLDAERLDVSKVESSEKLADYVVTDHQLTLVFAEPVPVGKKVEVTVTYTAEPQKGLYFRTPELGYPAEDTHVWTQGQTHEAPHWFPCFDYPNERSTTEVICTVPEEMKVVSNGRVVSEETKDGMKRVHWLQDKPHASYLVCLVAGKFHVLEDQHKDVKLRFFAQPTLAEHADNAFLDTRTIMEFYEEEIGMPFPWDKYDQATIRDFTSGGMENTSITTLYHNTIFADETENIYSSRNLDAHEMAHQWFGDYVTCEDWAHLWLNEGFASYYTHLYDGHKLGRDAMLYGLYGDATDDVLPQSDNPKPIVYRGYDNAWEQFDFRAYPKGSWVLHMLRSQLGEDLYRKGIRHYLEKNGQSSVVTADLIAALEEVSGKELDRFFDQWVYGPGTPKLKVRYNWLPKEKLAQVTIEQTQEVNDKRGLFEIPTKLRFIVDGKPVDHAIELTKAKQEFFVPLAAQPEVVRFDPEYTVLADVDFEKPMTMLEKQIVLEGDMIGRLLAAKALGNDKSQKAVGLLKEALNNDAFYGVRIQAAKSLEKIGTDESFEALVASGKQEDARVRLAVIEQIGKIYRPESLDVLEKVVANEKNPAIVAVAIRGMAKYPAEDVRRQIEAAMERDSFNNIIASAAIKALGETGDAELRGKVLRALQQDRQQFVDRDYAEALSVLAKLWKESDDKDQVRVLLETSLQDPARRVRVGAIEALGELGDPQSIPALTTFVSREGIGRDQMVAKGAIKKLEEDAPFVPAEVRELRKLIGDMRKEQETLRKELDTIKAKGEAQEDAPKAEEAVPAEKKA